MYTEKQIAIIETLLNKWNARNKKYNSIIISDRQFFALKSCLATVNYCGHICYYGKTSEGREFSIYKDSRRDWYAMIFQSTAAEIAEKKAEEARNLEAYVKSAEYQEKALAAMERIKAGKAGPFDKAICKNAGLL